MDKGKSVTTSVPSISIKFHANAEQIEELYGSEDESATQSNSDSKSIKIETSNIGEPDSSPFKYFQSKIGKRSTSIDNNSQSSTLESSSPPSDTWKFLTDIKGKITKSVEEKITEIKSRNLEEGSPLKQKKDVKEKDSKESKENSSISDSAEDLSESSISKTCGIISTTEGVEMSSDDDTPSLDKDKSTKTLSRKIPSGLRQRFRLLRKSGAKEGTVNVNSLSKLYNINTEKVEQALPDTNEEVESAVDALDDNFQDIPENIPVTNEEIIKRLAEKIDNIEIDKEQVVNIKEVSGRQIRNDFFSLKNNDPTTVFAATGFIDVRHRRIEKTPINKNRQYFFVAIYFFLYSVLHYYWPYWAGCVLGLVLGCIATSFFNKLFTHAGQAFDKKKVESLVPGNVFEVQAVKEYQPLTKYEGWINEYPEVYNPATYHISQTQSVYLRLQGNLLRLSYGKNKVPKRAMWNEAEIKPSFTHHNIYNLVGAKITLLPDGLAKKRHWSKKYPICVTLSKEQMSLDPVILSKLESEEEKSEKSKSSKTDKRDSSKDKQRPKKILNLSQRFSKLTEEEDFDLESDSRASTPSPDVSDPPTDEQPPQIVEEMTEELNKNAEEEVNEFDVVSIPDDWSIYTQEDSPTDLKLYIFGRTDREKEDWFRRLTAATHKTIIAEGGDADVNEITNVNNVLEKEYSKFMQAFNKPKKSPENELSSEETIEGPKPEIQPWLNSLLGRVLFDCMHNPDFINAVRDRIERKLGAIKLPYFIEELLVTELSLGKTAPVFGKTGQPVVNERGLWVDLDMTYEGCIVLTLQTKLNLMKLKNPPTLEQPPKEVRSAIYHSDVDDSAESSSDEEAGSSDLQNPPTALDPAGGASNSSKKFIKMVDKIAESRFFQAATENKYIKRAMEGVSNTDLRLKVEMRSLIGTMVLNIPPPPSDRVWVGFRPTPDILLSAHPIVGERNITFLYVTSWIEKKLLQEFQKIMVIPNMEDFIIPVMNQKLPE